MKLIKIGEFRITMDPLLPLVVIIMAWVLSERYYPELLLSHHAWVYWIMGIVSSLFLTISIFIHELGHAFTARKLKLPLERIHLFLFGGMAELKHRPSNPWQEFCIALAGPVASFLFAGLNFAMLVMLSSTHSAVYYVLQYIIYMNLLLGLFNLLPIFPLDGGRAVRALFWRRRRRYQEASRSTFALSLVLIAMLMTASLASLFFFNLMTTIWISLLSAYLAYTAWNGKKELIYQPEFSDLIMGIGYPRTPDSILKEVKNLDGNLLPRCLIPVLYDERLQFVIHGKDLSMNGAKMDLEAHYRPVENGHFIDILKRNTYNFDVRYKADFIPVLQNGFLLGLCDAHELRFWLIEEEKADF